MVRFLAFFLGFGFRLNEVQMRVNHYKMAKNGKSAGSTKSIDKGLLLEWTSKGRDHE